MKKINSKNKLIFLVGTLFTAIGIALYTYSIHTADKDSNQEEQKTKSTKEIKPQYTYYTPTCHYAANMNVRTRIENPEYSKNTNEK